MAQANSVTEAIGLLNESGMLARLKDEAQRDREIEREKLLSRLAEFEATQAEAGKHHAEEVVAATERVRLAEEALRAARAALNEATNMAMTPATGEKLRGKLRRLADPAIDDAARALADLADRARGAFRSNETTKVDPLSGRKFMMDVSNAAEIAHIQARITMATKQLEVLRESRRPDNLSEVLESITSPIRDEVRTLLKI
ncbi:MAG: hypothetical protein AB1899_16880 [Pseudomonadota bacterium]